MKKNTLITLTTCTTILFSLTACSNHDISKQGYNKTSKISTVSHISNFTDYDNLNDAMDFVGFNIVVPDSINDMDMHTIRANQTDGMIEIIYRNQDNDLHIRKAIGNGDISGNYNHFYEEHAVDVDGLNVTMKGTHDKVNIATWNKGDYAYSIDSSASIDKVSMIDLIRFVSNDNTDTVQIPNPWEDLDTLEDAKKLVGFDITAPNHIEGYPNKIIRVNSTADNKLIEVIYQNGNKSETRIRKGLASYDISRDYNEYTNTNTISVGDLEVTMRGNSELVNVATWLNGKYTFSISVSNGISKEGMTSLITSIQ